MFNSQFSSLPIRKKIPKALAWIVMLFGLFVIIVGAIVKDDMPASAQEIPVPAEQVVPAQTEPTQIQPAEAQQPAVPGEALPVQAMPDGGTPNQINPEYAAPADAQAPTVAEGIPAGQAIPAEPQAAQVPSVMAQPQADVPVPQEEVQQAPEEDVAEKYAMGIGKETVHNTKALIEEKRANDTTSVFSRIMSIVGIFGFIGIAWLLSNNRKKVLWKLVAVGTAIQLVFAIFILWTPVGRAIFSWLNDAVTVLLNFTSAGTSFLFASYAAGTIESPLVNTAMAILPPIIFFSSLMTVLYYLGVMQWIVKGMASFMMRFMGTSGSESLSSVANIFVGMTEAPLVVKPYVAKMTQSELFAIMTGGMATVAGGTMAAYVSMLLPFFPDIAGHLIAASVMSAPASLVVAKLMIPETEESETMGEAKLEIPKTDANVIDAAARGAGEGLHLALNVGAMLLAFIALIALINFVLGMPSRLVNAHTYKHVAGYVVSAGGELDPACDSIYSTSDTIACTHGALLKLADLKSIEVDESLRKLGDEQSEQIETTETLYDVVLGGVGSQLPNANSPAVIDCENTHDVAACGAVVAVTQQESWTPTLEKKTIWPLLKLETLFGWLFFPFAFLMGVPWGDCFLVGQLLGEKMAVNEFVAYLHFAHIIDKISYRGIVITTYALCGFANFGSIAIQIGGIGGMAPNRRSDIAKMGIKAMIAGSIAAFMTATIAGALI